MLHHEVSARRALPSRRLARTRFFVGCVALGLAACGSDAVVFPEGLAPVGENAAAWPAPEGADRYPERLTLVSEEGEEYSRVSARGYVHAPLGRVWEALRDPAVVVDARKVASYTVEWDVHPTYPVRFRLHNVVEDVVRVEFEVTWHQGVVDGEAARPRVVSAVYAKTWGTHFIRLMHGSVVLRAVDASTTSVELVEHLDAYIGAAESAESYNRDLYARLVERGHGRALPTY